MTNSEEPLQRSMLVFLALLCAATMCVAEEKVSVDLYYESLCPYSANFIVNYLENFFTDGLIDIVELRLIPYGNARIGPNLTISCQHGPYECTLNTIEACTIDLWPNSKQHFPFIYCVESFMLEHKATEWVACFGRTDLDFELIVNCYTSEYGKKLNLQCAEETKNLQPPHQYVPWVVVNGQPLYEEHCGLIFKESARKSILMRRQKIYCPLTSRNCLDYYFCNFLVIDIFLFLTFYFSLFYLNYCITISWNCMLLSLKGFKHIYITGCTILGDYIIKRRVKMDVRTKYLRAIRLLEN